MRTNGIRASLVPLALALAALCQAQGSADTDVTAKLREQIAAQQKQLDEQRRALDAAQRGIASTQAAIESQQKLLDQLLRSRSLETVAPQSVAATHPALAPAESAENDRADSPFSFRIGGAEFSPGGFMDFSTVWRSTNVGSGVATSFAAVPFSNTAAGRMQEFRSSAANSRVSLTITEHPTKNLAVMGYLEGDFSGNQPGSLFVTSNSNTWRMRHFWVNLTRGKWDVLGGQTWTLLTPNRFSTSPISSNVFLGLGEDANYMPGLVWARPAQVRVTYHPNREWSLAASVENPEQYVTTATTLPAFAAGEVDNGSISTTPNARPDIVAKAAYDSRISGKAFHFELAGFSRGFRISPAQGKYYSAQGLGGSADMVLEVAKSFRVIATGFYGSGGGRYLVGLGPDFVVGPDGSISPVHSMAGIGGFEYALSGRSQVFAYYGATYFDRNYMATGPGAYLGFGFPGSSSANRQFQEPSFGYYYTCWKNPKYGALQIISEYAYLSRAPWYVAPGTPSTAHAHMIFSALRFTLPRAGGPEPELKKR